MVLETFLSSLLLLLSILIFCRVTISTEVSLGLATNIDISPNPVPLEF